MANDNIKPTNSIKDSFPPMPVIGEPIKDKSILSKGAGPEDIFADVVKEKQFIDRLPVKNKGNFAEEEEDYSGSYRNRFLINLAVMASVLLVILLVIWMSYAKMIKGPQQEKPNDIKNNQIIPLKNDQVETKQSPNAESNVSAKKDDTDGDGLSDDEERSLGMNILKPDTDDDGLYDRDEVKVYKTDPLKPDTDGDEVSDGEEVKKGDNPKGPGKLYDMSKQFVAPGSDVKKIDTTRTEDKNLDTDGDGLSDFDETNIYKTDPNKFDTDGDSYDDGTEVKKGFNPLLK